MDSLLQLRMKIDKINQEILSLLCERGEIVQQIGAIHAERYDEFFNPEREQNMLEDLLIHNRGPFSNETIIYLFKEIFKASLNLEENQRQQKLLVHISRQPHAKPLQIRDVVIGHGDFTLIAGPCSIESAQQLANVADFLKEHNIRFLRGGAFKPRSSPYSFQGLGLVGLEILHNVGQRFNMITVSEIMDPRDVDIFERYVDVLQIGARNMHNSTLLKVVGQTGKPVFLKRGMMATLREFLLAAEYVLLQNNPNVILCERGIRTFENATRNTLDLSAIAILKKETYLPVVVDISHSTGRRDIAGPVARAAKAIGADGIMVEVHPNPFVARSDNEQQLDFEQFEQLLQYLA